MTHPFTFHTTSLFQIMISAFSFLLIFNTLASSILVLGSKRCDRLFKDLHKEVYLLQTAKHVSNRRSRILNSNKRLKRKIYALEYRSYEQAFSDSTEINFGIVQRRLNLLYYRIGYLRLPLMFSSTFLNRFHHSYFVESKDKLAKFYLLPKHLFKNHYRAVLLKKAVIKSAFLKNLLCRKLEGDQSAFFAKTARTFARAYPGRSLFVKIMNFTGTFLQSVPGVGIYLFGRGSVHLFFEHSLKSELYVHLQLFNELVTLNHVADDCEILFYPVPTAEFQNKDSMIEILRNPLGSEMQCSGVNPCLDPEKAWHNRCDELALVILLGQFEDPDLSPYDKAFDMAIQKFTTRVFLEFIGEVIRESEEILMEPETVAFSFRKNLIERAIPLHRKLVKGLLSASKILDAKLTV